MKIVYESKSEYEKREEEKNQKLNAKAEAERILALVDKAPDELFPDFLWHPIVNEFSTDDGYLMKGSTDIAEVQAIFSKNIHRKYNDYWEYLDALEAYWEYAHFIEDTYGSFEMMRRSAEEGLSSIYIPKLPKLSNKKMNKRLLSSGFIPSRIEKDFEVDLDVIKKLSDALPMAEIDDNMKIPKYMVKQQKNAQEKWEREQRKNSIFIAGAPRESTQGTDAIINFLTNGDVKYGSASEGEYSSVSEMIDSLHEWDNIPEDLVDYLLAPDSAFIQDGRLVRGKEANQLRIIEDLERNGWDFFSTMLTKGMNKEAIRAVSSRLGSLNLTEEDLVNLSKKQRKKLKKLIKNKEVAAKKKAIGNRRMQALLTQNRVHLSMEDNAFLDFRLSDVIPDDD